MDDSVPHQDFAPIPQTLEMDMSVGEMGESGNSNENPLTRNRRSPYNYGYTYNTRRGHGSGYGYGYRNYGHGHHGCYNCGRPRRPLRTAVVVGGAAFAGGFIGSSLG